VEELVQALSHREGISASSKEVSGQGSSYFLLFIIEGVEES
jgi:hypothetical protein